MFIVEFKYFIKTLLMIFVYFKEINFAETDFC